VKVIKFVQSTERVNENVMKWNGYQDIEESLAGVRLLTILDEISNKYLEAQT